MRLILCAALIFCVCGLCYCQNRAGNGGLLLPSGPLSTRGSQIVDGRGIPVRIAAVGWYGSNGKAGYALQGLWQASYKSIVDGAKVAGFNCIRIPWSDVNLDAPLLGTNEAGGVNWTLNADLRGLGNFEIFEKIVAYCATVGMKVIFDHHDNEGCGGQQWNGLWFDAGPGSDRPADGHCDAASIDTTHILTHTKVFKGAFLQMVWCGQSTRMNLHRTERVTQSDYSNGMYLLTVSPAFPAASELGDYFVRTSTAVAVPCAANATDRSTLISARWIPVGSLIVMTGGTPGNIGNSAIAMATRSNNGLFTIVLDAPLTSETANGDEFVFSEPTDGHGHIGSITNEQFQANWLRFARQYKGNSTVIGYDLDNEPLSSACVWGMGKGYNGYNDICRMYRETGNLIQKIDSTKLIICEAINDVGLAPAASNGVVLNTPHKLVYSVHCYGDDILGQINGPDGSPVIRDSGAAAVESYNRNWGFLVSRDIAPVWIGEYGSSMDGLNHPRGLAGEQAWALTLTDYMNGKLGAQGGPSFSGTQQGLSGCWWNLGTEAAGANPNGIQTAWGPGNYRPEQLAVTSQTLMRRYGRSTIK